MSKKIVAVFAVIAMCACSGGGGGGAGGAGGRAATGAGGVAFVGANGAGGSCPVCDGGTPDAGSADAGACDAGTIVHYSMDVAPVLAGCTGELCHQPWAYDALVDRPSSECCERLLVAPSDPAHSYLLDKIEGHNLCCGSQMPAGGVPLDAATIARIADWICEGAPLN